VQNVPFGDLEVASVYLLLDGLETLGNLNNFVVAIWHLSARYVVAFGHFNFSFLLFSFLLLPGVCLL